MTQLYIWIGFKNFSFSNQMIHWGRFPWQFPSMSSVNFSPQNFRVVFKIDKGTFWNVWQFFRIQIRSDSKISGNRLYQIWLLFTSPSYSIENSLSSSNIWHKIKYSLSLVQNCRLSFTENKLRFVTQTHNEKNIQKDDLVLWRLDSLNFKNFRHHVNQNFALVYLPAATKARANNTAWLLGGPCWSDWLTRQGICVEIIFRWRKIA